MLTVEDIKKAIEGTGFENYGIRIDSQKYDVGDICENSHQWWQDSDTAEAYGLTDDDYNEDMKCWDGGELDGTCTIGFDINDDASILSAIEQSRNYFGDYIHVLGGFYSEAGNDMYELIISDAEVLGVFDK